MAKKQMPRVTEPDFGTVHYGPDGLSGNVTLCGKTDWIRDKEMGEDTELPVSCDACISIKAHCDTYRK